MSSLNLYLSTLDTSTALDTAGTFTGSNTAAMSSTDVSLHYASPVAKWARIFKYYTDGTDDVSDEGVKLMTEQGLNIIGDTNATSSSGSVSDLYASNASLSAVYTAHVLSDISAANGDTTDPAASLDYLSELSRAIFGSPEAIDMMSNESAVAASYGVATETCSAAVSANFATAGNADYHSVIGSSNNAAKLVVCKTIYDQLRYTTANMARFTLNYGTTVTGTLADTTAAAVTGGSATSDATVNVFATGATIDNLEVSATGVGYAKGDVITITMSVGNTIAITLNSSQAAILNGSLDSTAGTELPLEVDDMFHIKYTINSNASQANVSGGAFETVTRTADVYIKLV